MGGGEGGGMFQDLPPPSSPALPGIWAIPLLEPKQCEPHQRPPQIPGLPAVALACPPRAGLWGDSLQPGMREGHVAVWP